MLASRRPSMGEILSNVGPPPRHSPSNTPALSSVRPSFSRGVFIFQNGRDGPPGRPSCCGAPGGRALPISFSLSAILAHQFHRFVDHLRSDVERGAEADRVLAGTKGQNTKVEEAMPKFFARFPIGEIEGEKYSATARGGNQRFFRLQVAQLIEEIGPYFRGVLNQTFLLDDAQIMGRAHHICEVPAPR